MGSKKSGPGDACGPSLSPKDFRSHFPPAESDIIIQQPIPSGALSLKQAPITVMGQFRIKEQPVSQNHLFICANKLSGHDILQSTCETG